MSAMPNLSYASAYRNALPACAGVMFTLRAPNTFGFQPSPLVPSRCARSGWPGKGVAGGAVTVAGGSAFSAALGVAAGVGVGAAAAVAAVVLAATFSSADAFFVGSLHAAM